jgi:hypothetical protein
MQSRAAVVMPIVFAGVPLILIFVIIRWPGAQLVLALALGALLSIGVVGTRLTEQAPRRRKALVIGLWALVVIEVFIVAALLVLLSRAVRFMH